MNSITKTIAVLLLGTTTPALSSDQEVLPVSTDEVAQYRNVGDWGVDENITRGSCCISRTDEAGHLVQLGLTKDAEYGYIGIFQKGIELEEGSNDVAILVNDHLYIDVSKTVAHGASGGCEGGNILANDKKLRLDLEKQKKMIVFPDKPFKIRVNPDHMRNAMYEARECTKKLQGS